VLVEPVHLVVRSGKAGGWRPKIASGEACEAGGAVQSLLDGGCGDAATGDAFIAAMGRANACVTGLIQRHRP
jgi:hypothetical protein